MLQQAPRSHVTAGEGTYFLVNSMGEHGPFNTYKEAINAAESPAIETRRFDHRRGYFVVDRSEQEAA